MATAKQLNVTTTITETKTMAVANEQQATFNNINNINSSIYHLSENSKKRKTRKTKKNAKKFNTNGPAHYDYEANTLLRTNKVTNRRLYLCISRFSQAASKYQIHVH